MSSTTYAKRKLYKPIDFFYRGIADAKTKKVVFVDAFQILNDRFLGRMSVCNYFFIAENSVRINELNVIALDELKNYHQVMRENFLVPEKVTYSLPITTRFLESDKEFDILIASLKENGYKKGSLLISFNCNTIMHIDEEGKKRYDRLRRFGYKTCISGFGEEFNALDIFAKLNFDYLRVEASYFDSTPAKKKLLIMLVQYCKVNKIGLIMEGVDTPPQLNRFKKAGVKLVTGKAVSKLSRFVTNEFLGLPELTGEKKAAYIKKLQAEIAAQEKKEQAEYEALRLAAIAKAKEDAAAGRVAPVAPRPELMKSPYQVRLEQQKETARRAAIAREEKLALKKEEQRLTRDEYREKKLVADAQLELKFEGELQGALALGAASDEKMRARLGKFDIPNKTAEDKTVEKAQKESAKATKSQKKAQVDADALQADVPQVQAHPIATEMAAQSPENVTEEKSAVKKTGGKKKKNITPDTERAERLYNEVKRSSLDDMLAPQTALGGFGVKLDIDDDDDEDEVIVGHYNEKGQWIDEDGYIYNGYFDDNGDWQDYDTFNAAEEGSYNDEGKWVDKDGNVYNGYFDEQGRWIDYTYVTADGTEMDNGYFDEKLGKWVPYGYFDENGIWREYK